MVTLKTVFADDDHLLAGAAGDSDKINGVTNQVNLNTSKRITNTGYVVTMFDTLVPKILDGSIATPSQCLWWKNAGGGDKNAIETVSPASSNYKVVSNKILAIQVLDEINDSSIHSMWSYSNGGDTANVHDENSDYQWISCTAWISGGFSESGWTLVKGNGSGGKNWKQANDIRIRMKVYLNVNNTSGGTSTAKFGLTDGSNYVWLKTLTISTEINQTDDSVWDIVIDQSANTCDVYNDNVLMSNDVDISSLSSYYLCMRAESSGGAYQCGNSATARFYYVYWFEASMTATLYFDEETPGSSAKGCMVDWTHEERGGDIDWFITANDSAYTELTSESSDLNIGTPGTTVRAKATISLDGATNLWDGTKDLLDPTNAPCIENFVCIYRLA